MRNIFLVTLLLLSRVTFSKQVPGLIQTLQTIVNDHRGDYAKYIQKLRTGFNPSQIPADWSKQDIEIDSLFLQSISLHSDEKYLKLVNLNDCSFAALLENDLLKTTLGYPKDIPIILKKEKRTVLIPKEEFTKGIYQNKCFNYLQISKLFESLNLRNTLKAIDYKTPKSQVECDNILKDWYTNPYLPYLCEVPEKITRGQRARLYLNQNPGVSIAQRKLMNARIRDGEFFEKNSNFFQQNYFRNLCNSVNDKKIFCSPYLADDVWSKVLNGEKPKYILENLCRNFFGNQSLSKKQLQRCVKKFKDEPHICTTRGQDGYPSLFPRPNCNALSVALNNGRLKTKYTDCPGRINNSALTNTHRVINHLFDNSFESSPNSCHSEANFNISKLSIESKTEEIWPLKVCYKDLVDKKKQCELYIPGDYKAVDYNEEIVVRNILFKLNKVKDYKTCRLVSKREYKPVKLEYKNGCFIVYDDKSCSNSFCERKIFVDKEEIKQISYEGIVAFDYFPTNYINSKSSIQKLIETYYKKKFQAIKNITELEVYLKNKSDGIIQGVGCSEDIYPRFFSRKSLNQCTPLPFIIDGAITKNENKLLVFRSSLDSVHYPRLVPWNFVFTGLSNMKEQHPLKSWLLYGTK